MSIPPKGWVLHVVRHSVQKRTVGKRVRIRTVGTYQVFHDGKPQTGPDMQGTIAESKGLGANRPRGNGKRIEKGQYPLATQDGEKYVTFNYDKSISSKAKPKPGFLLTNTDKRVGILVHPGIGFLASIGCFNPCTSLPNEKENIDFVRSRERVIRLIDDMRSFLGKKFPTSNGKAIPDAFVVVDGEP